MSIIKVIIFNACQNHKRGNTKEFIMTPQKEEND